MNTTMGPIRPTRQALRVHRSHLATTHRAPLVPRRAAAAPRPTAFTPMAPYSLTGDVPRHHES